MALYVFIGHTVVLRRSCCAATETTGVDVGTLQVSSCGVSLMRSRHVHRQLHWGSVATANSRKLVTVEYVAIPWETMDV